MPVLGGDFRAAHLLVPFLFCVPNLVVTKMLLRKHMSGILSREVDGDVSTMTRH